MTIDWNKQLVPLEAQIETAIGHIRSYSSHTPERHDLKNAIEALQRAGALVAAIHGEASVILDELDRRGFWGDDDDKGDAEQDIRQSAENIIGYAGLREMEDQS